MSEINPSVLWKTKHQRGGYGGPGEFYIRMEFDWCVELELWTCACNLSS